MMCRHELGSLQGPGPVITSTENRTAKPAEDGPRAKFLCSFGGSILPRPSDGKLRYAGGETRMVSVSREISYRELMAKMTELYDQALTVKYQQPDEDLDALVSVVCDEDVANMMEEYDKLQARDGFSRLRLFLFSAAEHRDLPSVDAIERPRQQRYVDALNGLPESSKNPEIPVIGVGVAHEVAAALPVPSVQPLLPVASSTTATTTSSSSSSPSSPCCSGQVPVGDQYYPRKSESYVASDAEILSEGQFDINAGMHHSGFVFDREYKQSTEAFMANAEASGNLPQIWPQFDWQHTGVPSGIEISKDRGIPDDLSIQFNMQHRPPPRQQQMLLAYQQAAGHSAGGVYRHHELVYKNYHDDLVPPSSPQNKPFLHPLVRQEEEKRHPKNDNGIERSWSAQYYATASQISHNFSSLLRSGSEADYHGTSAALACEVDFGNAYQQNVQMHWVCDEYGNRADYGSDEVSGNFLPFSSCLACNSHMCSDEHVMWQHQQPVFLGEDTSFQVQNLNHLQSMFDENSLTELHYASGQAGEDLSEVWSSNSYQQHLPPHLDQPGSNKAHFKTLKEGGEYHPNVSKDQMSAQNATAMVDQRMYPVEQAETRTNFQERLDKARGWVLNQANHQTEEVRMPMAGKADGVCVADRSTHRDFGPNNYWGCYSGSHCCINPADSYHIPPVGDFYKPVISNYDKPQAHAPVIVESGTMHGNITAMYSRDSFLRGLKTPEMENCSQGKVQSVITGTHLDHTSGVHLQPNNGQSFRLLGVVEERAPEAVSGRNDGPKIERMGHPHVLYRNNVTADAPNIPCYMPDDLLSKNMNNSNNDDHHFMGPHLVREIEDINSLTVVSIKGQAGFEHGALTTWESNVFVASGSNKVLPDHSFSCVVTSTNLVHDRSTLLSHEALPSITSSSPPRSDILSSISPPVYDQSPANSRKATVPENFWSECEGGREVKELKTKVVAENNSMGIVTRQLGVEVYSNDSGASRQNKDVDKGMPDASLNDKVNADICHTSRPVESAVHHPSLSSSPVTLGSNEVDKQTSPGSAKEVVNKEDKDEGTLPISDTEEELGKREVPENYPSGVDEDSNGGSVEIAKSLSSEAELEALARGLQTIRNADLEEIRELGSGTYGTVYHGKWKGSDVAIKRIKASCFAGRPSERERLIADFWKEASILSQLHHPNVVSFYGVVRDGPGGTLATVTEFMVNGSLKQVLHKKDRTIDRRKRLIIAMDAAFGMEYLHGKNIVHFDLKCENLLVNMRDPHRPVCKIGDMGLSKVKHQTLVSGGVRGTLPWMAPELLTCKSGMVTDKIDVYSFGIVMWELLTGDEPYANMHCGSIIGGIMNNTLRPPVPSWCDPAWRSLMERCWSSDPGQRPPFSDIAKELRALAASINLK